MDDITVIILCGGYSGRWGNYLNIEKHFAVINNKSIIKNTLDILSLFDIKSIIITREDNQYLYENFNCDKVSIHAKYSTLEYYKIKSNYDFWAINGKTIILMGDVLYTKDALKQILFTTHADIRFFGRQTRSFYTKCRHGELFAISFLPQHHIKMKLACERLALFIDKKKIKISGGWGIYDIVSGLEYLITGESVIKGNVLFSNFNQIIDTTDDVDYPKDYNNYIELFSKKNLFNWVNMYVTSKLFYFYKDISNILYEIRTHDKRKRCLEESQIQ